MKKIAFILVGIFVMAFASDANADIINHLFRIQCMPELGYIEVSEIGMNGEVVEKQLEKNPEEIYKKYGIREYFSMLHYDINKMVYNVDTFTDICKIDNHKYEISVTPYYCNRNLEGRLGGHFSIDVSVDLDGKKLVDKLTFHKCNYKNDTEFKRIIKLKIDHYYSNEITILFSEGYYAKNITKLMQDNLINNSILTIKK